MNPGDSGADRIGRHFRHRFIDPARHDGRTAAIVRAGVMARDLHLRNRVPAVCSALVSKLLLEQAGLRLLERRGPRQGDHDRISLCNRRWGMRGERDRRRREEKSRTGTATDCGRPAPSVDSASSIGARTHALPGLLRQDEAQHSCTRKGSVRVAVVPEGNGKRKRDISGK